MFVKRWSRDWWKFTYGSKGALKSLGYRIWHRTHNRWMDARAVLAGACNASTWNPKTSDYDGGYSHWRCGKRRGHNNSGTMLDESHRFNNYVWDGPGSEVSYAPIPVKGLEEFGRTMDQILPFRRLTTYRHSTDSSRRTRLRHQAWEIKYQVQQAERRGS